MMLWQNLPTVDLKYVKGTGIFVKSDPEVILLTQFNENS